MSEPAPEPPTTVPPTITPLDYFVCDPPVILGQPGQTINITGLNPNYQPLVSYTIGPYDEGTVVRIGRTFRYAIFNDQYSPPFDYIDLSNTQISEIEQQAFFGCSVKSIMLPPTLGVISQASFSHCGIETLDCSHTQLSFINTQAFAFSALKSISFPHTLDFIGTAAFFTCSQLVDLDLSDTLINDLGRFDDHDRGIFYGCPLKTVNVSNCPNLTTLSYTFRDFQLDTVNISNSAISNVSGAFNQLTTLYVDNNQYSYIDQSQVPQGCTIVIVSPPRTTPVDYYLDPLNTNASTLIKPVTEYKNEYDAVAIYDITLDEANTLRQSPLPSGKLFGIGNLFTEALVADGKITDVDIKTALPEVGKENIIINFIKFVDSIVTPGNENTEPYIADLSNTKSLAQDYYILSEHIQDEVLTYRKVRDAFEEIDAALNDKTFIVGDTMSSELTINFFHNGLTHKKVYKLFLRVALTKQSPFVWLKDGNARIFNRDPTADYKVFGASTSIPDVFYPFQVYEKYLDDTIKQLAPQNGKEQLNYDNKAAVAGPSVLQEEDYKGYLINSSYFL